MKSNIITVMKKEFARFFGDKRLVVTTLLLPGLLIYFMYTFMGSAMTDLFETDDTFIPTVYHQNMPQVFIDDYSKMFGGVNYVNMDDHSVDIEDVKEDVKNGSYHLIAVFGKDFIKDSVYYNTATSAIPAPNVEIYYNSANTDSYTAYQAFYSLLEVYEDSIGNKFDINRDADIAYDLAEDEEASAMIFTMMMPMLLMMFLYSGCMAVAPESIAGEKERGTMATMLVTPVKRHEIALGKIFALGTIAVLSGSVSSIATIASLPKLMGGAEELVIPYGVKEYAMLALLILSTSVLIVSIISILSAFAKTVKEATNYITPLYIVTIFVGLSAMFGTGATSNIVAYLVPLYNSVQCMVGIFSFTLSPLHIIVTVAANIAYTAIAVFVIAKLFDSEKVMFSK